MLLIGEGTCPCKGFLETCTVVHVRALVYYYYFLKAKKKKKTRLFFKYIIWELAL